MSQYPKDIERLFTAAGYDGDWETTAEKLAEEIVSLRQRVKELEAEIKTWTLEARELHRTIAKIHDEYRPEVKDAELFRKLQNMDPVKAQAFFWNYKSRKQRAEAIHDYHFD